MERPNDKWLRLIGLPLAVLVLIPFQEQKSLSLLVNVTWFVVNVAYFLLIWEVIVRWLLFVRRRYTSVRQTRRRILITFTGYFVITASMVALLLWLAEITHTNTAPITGILFSKLLGGGLFCVLLLGSIFEFIYYIQKCREAIQESEAMKKVGLQSQYDSLKNQVNPHFLFNSLNSLSALISEDRAKAGTFLDELSSVYRYLLQAGQRPLVTLGDELDFLQAYRFLLDTRFGTALCWQIAVDESSMDLYLPSLTLQTLIENALRHNSLLPEKPLTLRIAMQPQGILLVGNDIQRKRAAVLSPPAGLATLATRFTALGLSAPVITDDGQSFEVRILLVPKEQVASDLLQNNTLAA